MVDQVNARFVDETMLGSYEYVPIEFIISSLSEKPNGQGGSTPVATFLDGSYS